ncbi:hypothetical protein MASR2M15_27720 [Anaerolineales bacterium]
MTHYTLDDVLILASQESHRMRHYYLGVEHLFIGLLDLKDGLTVQILADVGFSPEYIKDMIRRKISKGAKGAVQWVGIPETPRAYFILDFSKQIAQQFKRQDIQERDLLIAILQEGSSMVVHVLNALDIDLEWMEKEAHQRETFNDNLQSFLQIESQVVDLDSLNGQELFVLKRMFHGYERIQIESELTGGYSNARLFIVSPFHIDQRQDASVVVKIGQAGTIQDEAQGYNHYVKSTLPPLTARLEEAPTAPTDCEYAGLKYTLISNENGKAIDLREKIHDWDGKTIGKWIRQQVFKEFGKAWWLQQRPYRFEVWKEYDWLFPVLFIIDYVPDEAVEDAIKVQFPASMNALKSMTYGDVLQLDHMIINKVNPAESKIELAYQNYAESTRAFRIEVRNINTEEAGMFRGEIVERIHGRVVSLRSDLLKERLRYLEPDFDLNARTIQCGSYELPNPLIFYQKMMEIRVNGSFSIIHGDLHLGNILLGPQESAMLIDFEMTRDGHSLIDWATLEVSLLDQVIAPFVGETWDEVRDFTLRLIDHYPAKEDPLFTALESILEIRRIVHKLLAQADEWSEYFISLALCSLRAINWESMPINNRRLMFMMSALAMYEIQNRQRQQNPEDDRTISPDETEFMSNS